MCRDASSLCRGAKLLLWVIAPFLIYAIPSESIYGGHSLCLFTNIFGIHCYGCGITRAIYAAAHLDFELAVDYNCGVVVVLPLLIYLWIKGSYQLFKSYQDSKKAKN